MIDIQFPPSGRVRKGLGSASRGDAVVAKADVCSAVSDGGTPGSRVYRYTVERGSGSSGTAYNKLDHEVLDLAAQAGARVICRATRTNAHLICSALNRVGGA